MREICPEEGRTTNNGGKSIIRLRSTGGAMGAARARGITANDICLDEFQSLEIEDIPVIEETAATFDGRDGRPEATYYYTGTPLSSQNQLQQAFNNSYQWQWHMQCPHCSHGTGKYRTKEEDYYQREIRTGGWQHPIGMQHIDERKPYLFCEYCGRNMNHPTGTPAALDADNSVQIIPPWGQWIAHNPHGKFDGYRITRMMMPWARWRTSSDDGILDRVQNYVERQFFNEVMGLSYDSGQQPITEAMIRRISSDYVLPQTEDEITRTASEYRRNFKFAGLDWAMQAKDDATASYTIFGIFALVSGKLKLIFAHRFIGLGSNDPEYVLRKIITWMDLFEVTGLGADYGIGYKEDIRLMERFGVGRVAAFQYKGMQGRAKCDWDPNSLKWMVPKTRTLDQLCKDIADGQFILPKYEDAKLYTDDWLRLGIDMDPRLRTVRYDKMGPEDFVHVANYASLAKRLHFRDGEFSPLEQEAQSPRRRPSWGVPSQLGRNVQYHTKPANGMSVGPSTSRRNMSIHHVRSSKGKTLEGPRESLVPDINGRQEAPPSRAIPSPP